MSDRGDWDPWDFGEPEDDGWEDPDDLDPYGAGPDQDLRDEPTVAAAPVWGERPELDEDRPPRGALLAALGVMLVLAVAIAAIVLRDDDDGDGDDGGETASEVETDDEATSTSSSTSSSTSTSVAAGGEGTPGVPGSTSTTARSGSATTRPPGSTTTTVPDEPKVPDCAHGGGGPAEPVPADWAERWETMPRPNDPARISICIDDVTPRVGQTVTVTLRGDDPDAVIVQEDCGYLLFWEDTAPLPSCRGNPSEGGGPRPTPPQEPGHVIVRFTHVYGSAGARTITGGVVSSRWEGYVTPYTSTAQARLPITVHV